MSNWEIDQYGKIFDPRHPLTRFDPRSFQDRVMFRIQTGLDIGYVDKTTVRIGDNPLETYDLSDFIQRLRFNDRTSREDS